MNKGFTLIELLLTISILSIVFGASICGFSSLMSSTSLTGAAQQTANDLYFAKQKAVAGSNITDVTCASDTCSVKSLDLLTGVYKEVKRTAIPKGTSFTGVISFRFSASGYPLPGYIGTAVVQNSSGRSKKIVVSSVGRIRIE